MRPHYATQYDHYSPSSDCNSILVQLFIANNISGYYPPERKTKVYDHGGTQIVLCVRNLHGARFSALPNRVGLGDS
jgi:hypothetical protein